MSTRPRFRFSKISLVGSIAMIAAALTGCSNGETAGVNQVEPSSPDAAATAPSSDDVVRVGLVLPLSGSQASFGVEQRKGFDFAMSQIAADGGVECPDANVQIEVVTADDTSDARVAVDESRRLVSREHAEFLVGFASTNQILAASPLLEELKVPGLSVTGQTPGPGDYLFTQGITAVGMAETKVAFLDWLNEEYDLGIEKVAIARADYEAGQAVAEAEQELLEDLGYDLGTVVALPAEADLTPAILQLKRDEPDAILSTVLTSNGPRLHEARAAQDYHEPIWIGNFGGWAERSVWDAIGEEVAKKTLANRSFVMNYYDSSVEIGATADLISAAEEAGVDSDFGGHFVMGAQAARVVEAAIEQACAEGQVSPETLYDAMFMLDIPSESGNLYVPRDSISFTEERVTADQGSVVLQWTEDGQQVPVFPAEYADAEPRL